ncbi:MFS transporter [Microbacterium sp. Mu-80]|uniref:MFS transporter n=1 Tax=Microbacterium bandirmense TaxID=3122050 RepID=A0ABU8LBQ2_9MICO
MTRERMPKGFTAWVAATVGADLGSGVLAFALTWVASGHGPNAAAAVLTLTVAPTALFGLLGGAVADRYGVRRVMIACTLALMLISTGLALVVTVWPGTPITLLVAAAAIGTVAAFHRPAIGVFPRLFVAGAGLGTAMARVGVASQIAGTIAPPLGGLLIGLVALSGVAWIDVLGCAIMVVVLLCIRPPLTPAAAPDAVTARGIIDGLRTARRTPGIPTLLLCVGLIAGAVLPAVILGIPLAARERGWSAAEAGLIEAGWIAGGLVTGLWFSWRGIAVRMWRPMTAGAVVVALGLGGLASAPLWMPAAASTCVVGAGVVMFTAHAFPTYLLLAPARMLSRFQSLLVLVQRAPQLVIAPLVGAGVAATSTGPMLAFAGVLALFAAFIVASDATLRSFTSATSGSA